MVNVSGTKAGFSCAAGLVDIFNVYLLLIDSKLGWRYLKNLKFKKIFII